MRFLERLVYNKTNNITSYRDSRTKVDLQDCYMELRPISPKLATCFRRLATMLLKAGHNNCLAMKAVVDELEVRTWIEDPKSDFYR